MQYYYSINGQQQQGPTDAAALRSAGVGPDTMVWCEGMPDWQPAASVPELAGYFPPVPPVPPGPPGPPPRRPDRLPPVSHDSGTNGYAIASLVCGILGLVGGCCCPGVVLSVLAVIFGNIARGQIRRGHGSGDTLATVGLILGIVGIVFAVLGLGFAISNRGFRVNEPNFNWHIGRR